MLYLVYFFISFFFFNDTATTEIYTLSLHDALPIYPPALPEAYQRLSVQDCRIRLRELQREAAQRCANGRCGSAESREWAGLASHYRMALVLLAGIDGEIEELGPRGWRGMPPPERGALRPPIPALRSCLLPLRALALRT